MDIGSIDVAQRLKSYKERRRSPRDCYSDLMTLVVCQGKKRHSSQDTEAFDFRIEVVLNKAGFLGVGKAKR